MAWDRLGVSGSSFGSGLGPGSTSAIGPIGSSISPVSVLPTASIMAKCCLVNRDSEKKARTTVLTPATLDLIPGFSSTASKTTPHITWIGIVSMGPLSVPVDSFPGQNNDCRQYSCTFWPSGLLNWLRMTESLPTFNWLEIVNLDAVLVPAELWKRPSLSLPGFLLQLGFSGQLPGSLTGIYLS